MPESDNSYPRLTDEARKQNHNTLFPDPLEDALIRPRHDVLVLENGSVVKLGFSDYERILKFNLAVRRLLSPNEALSDYEAFTKIEDLLLVAQNVARCNNGEPVKSSKSLSESQQLRKENDCLQEELVSLIRDLRIANKIIALLVGE